MNNPYRRSDEYMQKYYGVKSQVELIASAVIFACLTIGAAGIGLSLFISWVRS